jgi:anti-anti-sigma factor
LELPGLKPVLASAGREAVMSHVPRPVRPHAARTPAEGVTDWQEGATEQLLYVDQILRISCTVMPGPSVIRIIGEIDRSNSAQVRRTLEQARAIDEDLVVDVGQVSFTDVSGVRELAGFAEGGAARVLDTPQQMRRLLTLMRLPSFDGQET